MTVSLDTDPTITAGGTPVSLSQLISVTSGGFNPTYLVLNGFDRNEYTAAASDATGSFSGGRRVLGLTDTDGDARENGIVFTYQSSTGLYYNSLYGTLDQLTYTASTSFGDITDLSLFGFSSWYAANRYAADGYRLMSNDPGGFLGSATIATVPSFAGPVPGQATPDSIAAIADGFVGQAWNMNGCWVLTSTIAAEAGASLPIQSTADIAGQASGEWFVAYNGPAGSGGNWQSMVQTGDMIGFVTGSGGGHITTCVSGSGNSAELVDNITYVDANGDVLNAANDGSADDVIIEPPHAASDEWAGVAASSVVIYRLDTPVVTQTAQLSLGAGANAALSSVASAADPLGRAITEYQAYLSDSADALSVNGTMVDATSAATAAAASALADFVLDGESTSGADTVTIRAFNGLYWGDWTSVPVDPSATTTTTAVVTSTTTTTTAPITPTTTGGNTIPVYRFFEQTDGAHFFTASLSEANALIATRPDLVYEGVGMNALASPTGDGAAEAVYRFFDSANGTHFYTASGSEQASLLTANSGLTFEGVAFYEDATQQQGDTAVYRFFDTSNGTHLYTDSTAERASILATRPDLVPEGVAFYAPA